MSDFRIGSVPYLNAAPLTFGLEAECQFLPPSQLAVQLHAGALDAALVSITEVLFHDGYDVLDGYGIISDGEVYSVFLAHTGPLEDIKTVHLDPASCTSANLIRVLLAARGIYPEYLPLAGYSPQEAPPNAVLIGNPAIAFRQASPAHRIWDLGAAWKEWTGLPFVYAAWAMPKRPGLAPLRARLAQAAESGLAALPAIVERHRDFDAAFRRRYLGGYIRHRLGGAEKEAVARFAAELGRWGARKVHPASYIST